MFTVREDVGSVRVLIQVSDVNDNAPVLATPQYYWPQLDDVIVTAIDARSHALTAVVTLDVSTLSTC